MHACQSCWELVQQEGFADIISVDCRDIFLIDIAVLEAYEINFIASSASVNDLFYLRMMQVALQLQTQYYIVNCVYLQPYKNLEILTGGSKALPEFAHYICKAHVAPEKGADIVSTRNLHWINTAEPELQGRLGITISFKNLILLCC